MYKALITDFFSLNIPYLLTWLSRPTGVLEKPETAG